jgi:TRAP-type transport system small permease protein
MIWLDRLFLLLAWIAGAFAALMMALTFTDVVARYLLNRSIHGAFEGTEILMGLIVFAALPLVVRDRETITVTILYDRYPRALRRAATVITDLICAGLCCFVAWRMWLYGERLLRTGEVTLELRIPRGGMAMTMAALLVVAAVAFLIGAVRAARRDPGAQGPMSGQG